MSWPSPNPFVPVLKDSSPSRMAPLFRASRPSTRRARSPLHFESLRVPCPAGEGRDATPIDRFPRDGSLARRSLHLQSLSMPSSSSTSLSISGSVLARERRFFRSRRNGSASVSSAPSSSVKFTRLVPNDSDGKEEASGKESLKTRLLLRKDRSNETKVKRKDKERHQSEGGKDDISYDFRSVFTQEEEEVLFAHLSADSRHDPDDSGSFSKYSVPVVTPPRPSNDDPFAPVPSNSPRTTASEGANHKSDTSGLDRDMAQAFALVGLVLDSYPELRRQYLARYRETEHDVDSATRTRANGSSLSKTTHTHSTTKTADAARPPLEVWMLLLIMVTTVFALDALVLRLSSIWSVVRDIEE